MKEWHVFVKVVEKGSITSAAKEMNLVPSAVSKIIAKLETELRVTLFFRNSRSLAVTPQGMLVYEKIKTILGSMDELYAEVRNHQETVKGTLRISVPSVVGEYMANIWIYSFLQKYKSTRIFLDTRDVFTNEAIEENDLILKTGEVENETLVHKRLTPLKLVLCASPNYLSQHKKIKEPKDLEKHSVFPLHHHGLAGPLTMFYGTETYTLQQNSNFRFSSNNLVSILNLVLLGHGISICTPGWLAAQKLYQNKLEIVLPNWTIPDLPVFLIWKQRQYYTPLFKEFSKFIADEWNNRPAITLSDA